MSSEFWVKLVNEILQTVLLIVLPTLAVLLVRWIKQEWKRMHLPDWVTFYAEVAVQAAEQAGIAELIQDKKKYAIGALQAFLDAHGVKLDAAALDAAIEDAVGQAKLNK